MTGVRILRGEPIVEVYGEAAMFCFARLDVSPRNHTRPGMCPCTDERRTMPAYPSYQTCKSTRKGQLTSVDVEEHGLPQKRSPSGVYTRSLRVRYLVRRLGRRDGVLADVGVVWEGVGDDGHTVFGVEAGEKGLGMVFTTRSRTPGTSP